MSVKVLEEESHWILNDLGHTQSKIGTSNINTFQYPLTLDTRHPTKLMFYAVESKNLLNASIDARANESVIGKFSEQTVAVIQTYMPSLNENISHGYNDSGGGFLNDLASNMPELAGETGFDKATELAGSILTTVMDKIKVAGAEAGGNFNAQKEGKILGGRSASMYSSTGLRTQVINLAFRPRNLSELKEVGKIISAFYIYSSSSVSHEVVELSVGDIDFDVTGNGFTALEVPPLWFLEERVNKIDGDSKLRHTPKFAMGPCAITNVRTNKTPEQISQTFANTAGDPIAIDLEITFKELRPVHSQYWKNLTKNLGELDSGEIAFGSFK
ncbi:baseplate tail-tube junction protein [Vibrio bivalvicida]|uniref:Baseplate tail tube cap n=1 Tax=Vibrio bivalvicida TaxID=1276888 RepID=A0A177XV12_9VIBR|nr:baseplate tail-tube junction protein [Vibrio bivalvicida]OAJ92430.1 hypothetical protein APB76_20770 [Vibrio bivalvicida]